jgi:hypothetical protein
MTSWIMSKTQQGMGSLRWPSMRHLIVIVLACIIASFSVCFILDIIIAHLHTLLLQRNLPGHSLMTSHEDTAIPASEERMSMGLPPSRS